MEMIAVIGIIGIMSLLVMPLIINQIGEKKDEISKTTYDVIFAAADLYLNNNVATYPKQVNAVYCVKLEDIVNSGNLKKPLKDVTTGKLIDTSRYLRVEVNSYGEYDEYELLDKGESCNWFFFERRYYENILKWLY